MKLFLVLFFATVQCFGSTLYFKDGKSLVPQYWKPMKLMLKLLEKRFAAI